MNIKVFFKDAVYQPRFLNCTQRETDTSVSFRISVSNRAICALVVSVCNQEIHIHMHHPHFHSKSKAI